MTSFLVFTVVGVGTYLSRSIFVLALGDRTLPEPVERAFRNIGPAVLAALTASLLTTDGLADYVTDVPAVLGTVAGVIVGLWRRSFVWAFVAAVAVWWLAGSVI